MSKKYVKQTKKQSEEIINILIDTYKDAKETYGEEIEKLIQSSLGYYVSPEDLYQSWIIDINEHCLSIVFDELCLQYIKNVRCFVII